VNYKQPLQAFLKGFSMRFPRGNVGPSWAGLWGIGNQPDWNVGTGSDSSVVMAPVQWLMRTFPEAPLVVDRRDTSSSASTPSKPPSPGPEKAFAPGDKPKPTDKPAGATDKPKKPGKWVTEPDHEMVMLLEQPNEYYSGDLLWRATVGETVIDGNAYWIKIRDTDLSVKEIWWIPSCLIEPKSPKDGSKFISHYEYRPGGEPIKLLTTDVVHFRWDIDPNDNRKGLSPLNSVLREVFADDEAGRFAASLLKNMGVPGLIVSPDGDFEIGDEDMKASKEELKRTFTGGHRGEPFVAGGPTKVHQFGFSPQQMDLTKLRRVPEERVSAVTGVAAIVAGLGAGLDRSTFANFGEAREASYESAMVPLQRLFASVLKHQLLPEWEGDKAKQCRCRFDLTEVRILQEDQNKITTRKLAELNGGAIMLSEYRSETGREIDDKMDVYIRPVNLTEVRAEDIGKPPEPPTIVAPPGHPLNPGATGTSNGNGNGKPHNGITPGAGKPPKVPSRTAPAAAKDLALKAAFDAQARLNETYDREWSHYAELFVPRADEVLDSIGLAVAEAYTMHPEAKAFGGEFDEGKVRQMTDQIIDEVKFEHQEALYARYLKNHYQLVADVTTTTLNDIFDLSVNLPASALDEIIAKSGMRAGLLDFTEEARQNLFDTLLEGRKLGEAGDVLARRIRDQVPAGRFKKTHTRAQLIARAETKFAQNISALAAYKEADATLVIAFDAQTGHSDPVCEARNGKTFTLEQAHHELASEHPNGTLGFSPIFG
jgi:HK97 family phage portal protein